MASSFEKSVKGATKIKAAPPKSKYIEHILIATHSGEAGVAEVFRALQNRLRDSTWTVVFKSLVTVHLMIREGSPDATLAYLARHRNMLAISSFSDVQTQGRNIRHYTNYLSERARAYRETKTDFVRTSENRLEKMTVDKGLLRETETVQHQITALLKCDVMDNEPENEITITVFRMLILDLLAMFQVMNLAVINILGHFFEMSKTDAERAMEIYKNFTRQTDFVVRYLVTARQYEHQTRVEVPKLKHAPIHLVKQLEDYLQDADFEVNRRQYIAELESKKSKSTGVSKSFSAAAKNQSETRSAAGKAFPDTQPAAAKPTQPTKGPDPDLIDFFESIEQNQQPMATQAGTLHEATQFQNGGPLQLQQQPQQFQQNGFVQQQTGFPLGPNPFSQAPQNSQQSFNAGFAGVPQPVPAQTNFTGAGFGGFSSQTPSFQPGILSSIPQESPASFQQVSQQQMPMGNMQTGAPQQTTNPFRQSIMMANPTSMLGPAYPASPPVNPSMAPQSTNPFAKSISPAQQPFSPPPDKQFQAQQIQQQQTAAPLRPMQTGTNPFAKNMALKNSAERPQTSGNLMPQPTGSTNPFRQSQFVNTATGSGWQNNQQPIGGGLDNLETVPVFPRPAQQQAWQH
ncbi:unnamed protein product [Diplocarpon coronariae]|uniref:ENTH domain-containing protein n=1 Tax=Diplocarpon coronariae TaxID=2795749 RepID=A0A218Z8Y9_9HELO|nr:hypothetical protein B2J93_2068 [Marssonina coronariae]